MATTTPKSQARASTSHVSALPEDLQEPELLELIAETAPIEREGERATAVRTDLAAPLLALYRKVGRTPEFEDIFTRALQASYLEAQAEEAYHAGKLEVYAAHDAANVELAGQAAGVPDSELDQFVHARGVGQLEEVQEIAGKDLSIIEQDSHIEMLRLGLLTEIENVAATGNVKGLKAVS